MVTFYQGDLKKNESACKNKRILGFKRVFDVRCREKYFGTNISFVVYTSFSTSPQIRQL